MAEERVPTLDEMARKGREKLASKADRMADEYYAAIPNMQENYNRLPFGPRRKAHYNEAMNTVRDQRRYRVDPDKWARKWTDKMSR